MEGEILKGHLDMLVLAAVRAGASHGYAIIEHLRERSGGLFELPEGTIYPVLHRLESKGLLSSEWTTGGRQRRVYKLTRAGTSFFGEQRKSWSDFARAVRLVIEGAL